MATRRTAGSRPATRAGKRPRRRTGAKKKRFPALLGILLTAAGLYVAVCGYLFLRQRDMLYHPTEGVLPTGEQTVEIQSGGETLRGWAANPGRDHAIIYFGGNAERLEHSISDYRDLFIHHTIYFVNYRGYGESTGTPTEEGLYADAEAVYEHVISHHENVTVIGRSLGTGVATHLAASRPVHALILVTPFDSMVNVAKAMYPIFPIGLLMKDRYDSAGRAEGITAPTLIIIAENDEVIPRESTDRLIQAFDPSTIHWAVIPGTTHNDIENYTEFYMRMRDFQITGR